MENIFKIAKDKSAHQIIIQTNSHPEFFNDLESSQLNALKSGDLSAFDSLPIVEANGKGSNYLDQFFKLLSAEKLSNVFANRFLYKDLTYYNGLYFDIISKSFGKVIGSGGRYDRVLDAFDLNSNAFGFAFRMHYLEKAIKNND